MRLVRTSLAILLLLAGSLGHAADKIDASLRAGAADDSVEVLLMLDGGNLPPLASKLRTVDASGAVQNRQRAALRSQSRLQSLLDARKVESRPFWIVNAIWARIPRADLERYAELPEVVQIAANPHVRGLGQGDGFSWLQEPTTPEAPKVIAAVEGNITAVKAPQVWALSNAGQGAVVSGADTGYQWDHPALKRQYRGWNGTTANHNYNWHDAIHDSVGNPCGNDSPAPCDDNQHGTHTMGTMVGDDGAANQIGVAPGARWIGCRNMNAGDGTPARYIECIQWATAPTNLSGNLPDPSMAPDSINNSWGCPTSEGCTTSNFNLISDAIHAARQAGVLFVASAGNSGSACSTVSDPPAIFAESFAVAATNNAGTVTSFSSRGPVTVDGSGRLKPDIAAPGSAVRSSIPGNSYSSLSGTSMAGPHVAGAVALLIGANPSLRGQPAQLQAALYNSAIARTSAQNCGSFMGSVVPNAVYGKGSLDVLAAVSSLGTLSAPSGSGQAAPATQYSGGNVLLTVTATPGTTPTSSGIVITGDLTAIGGSVGTAFHDDGLNGDATSGDNIFSYSAVISAATAGGAKSLPMTIRDSQGRTASTNIALTVTLPTSPTATAQSTPSTQYTTGNVLLTVAVTPGTNPASTGLAVTGDLTSIGGSAVSAFHDDGLGGDATPGDNVFSYSATISAATSGGAKSLPVAISDSQGRNAGANIPLTVTLPTAPTATAASTPSSQMAGGNVLFTVNMTPGTNPASSGVTVTANLTAIGGSASQAFRDDGLNGDVTAGDNLWSYSGTVSAGTSVGTKNMAVSVTDAQSRSASATLVLEVTSVVDAMFLDGFE